MPINSTVITVVGELWGALICLICVHIMILHRDNDRQDRCVRVMLFVCTLLLFYDSIAWAMDGHPGFYQRIMLLISNYLVFVCNYLLMALFNLYLWQMVKQNNEQIPVIMKTFWFFIGIALIIHTIGMFFGWYFYLDENNLYHRGPIFALSHAVAIAGIATLIWGASKYKERISGYERFDIISFCAIPAIATPLQIFIYGYPLQVFAIVIASIITFFVREEDVRKNLVETTKREQEGKAELEHAQKEITQALEKAQQASEAKTFFLNNMSHDIRTPMNAILGFASLMEKEKDNPKVIDEYLNKIKISGEYLLGIINNILDMARIDSGNVTVEKEFMDLSKAESSVISSLEALIHEKKQKFTYSGNITHKYVLSDKSKQQEITVNLLSNAIKYTPEGGEIRMIAEESPSQKPGYAIYRVIIEDTGIGMSPEFMDHIFDSFSREKNTTESKIIGTGLGMSIVKRLVDLLGGTIEVESEQGKGSKFTVTLELELVNNPEDYLDEESITTEIEGILEGKRVLLVEDNEYNAEIAIDILEDEGIIVEHAKNGMECIQMMEDAKDNYYDLILMDIQMPRMNGYDTTRQIRKMDNKSKANIPIIAMTANAFEEDKQKALDAGMNSHLAKPVKVMELTKTLAVMMR